MADRLSPLDASFLYAEEPTTPMHVGSVAVFQEPEDGFDHDRLVRLVADRIALVPRYRQRVREVPGRLANPVWADDAAFDIGYHVRRSALPKPGTDEQLVELVARVQSRPLDRGRPLWEMYLVEGLADDRFAVITKTHPAMVDGIGAVDIGQVILDAHPERPAARARVMRKPLVDTWHPQPEPTRAELVAGALGETIRRPTASLDLVRGGLGGLRDAAGRVAGAAGGLLSTGLTAARPAPVSPLNVAVTGQRRFATVATDLDDYRRVRKAHGGTVNDVVLAAVAGGLRAWLLTRGEAVRTSTTVRAAVPLSVHDDGDAEPVGNRVATYLVDLPVGEPSPVMRLHQVSYQMKAPKETGRAVRAESLVGLAGFAPPTLHALGARVASGMSRRWFNLVVTNVPGPQQPLYAGAARLLASYPVIPLARTQALSIGLTSYDGGVYHGLNADRDALPDLDVLAQCLVDAGEELLGTVR